MSRSWGKSYDSMRFSSLTRVCDNTSERSIGGRLLFSNWPYRTETTAVAAFRQNAALRYPLHPGPEKNSCGALTSRRYSDCFDGFMVGFLINAVGRTDSRRQLARRYCGVHTA